MDGVAGRRLGVLARRAQALSAGSATTLTLPHPWARRPGVSWPGDTSLWHRPRFTGPPGPARSSLPKTLTAVSRIHCAFVFFFFSSKAPIRNNITKIIESIQSLMEQSYHSHFFFFFNELDSGVLHWQVLNSLVSCWAV